MIVSLIAAVLTLGVGDVHVPEKVSETTPCVLLIHGGALALGENVWGYVFAKGRENAACLWTAPGARRTMHFQTTAKQVAKVDLFGNSTPIRIHDGRFDLVIEEEPVNLVFEMDSLEVFSVHVTQ